MNFMTQEEMLKRIHELEMELADEKARHYKTNERLNEVLLELSVYQEKYGIERTKQVLPKNEKIENIVVNEIEEIIKEERKEKKTNKGKKYKKKSFNYEEHVTETRYLEPQEKECPICNAQLVVVSEKVRYAIEVIPPQIKVIKLIKQTKKCPNCNKENHKLYYPLSNEVFNGSILTPSLSSFIMYYKYDLGIPFHHLANHLTASLGFEITKQNLANYMAKTCDILNPIYEQMKADLLNNPEHVLHSDETTLVVSKKDEENQGRKKSYVYVYTSSFYNANQIRIYDFKESRSIDATTKWLSSFKGIVHCDDYAGYDALKKNNPNIQLQRCWAHVRRRFADIVKSLPKKAKSNSIAYKILMEISKLFALEAKYKKSNKNPIQILECRKKDIPPILQKIKEYIFNTKAISNSALESALNYTKKCWNDLLTFMENGYVELTNNAAERAVKPFAIQRKVFQTSGSYAGARYTAKLFSIIQTSKINNIDIEKYLIYVLSNINKLPIKDLTPYSKHIYEVIK